ncbi:MAG: recombinase family protein [Mucinivorans sp.]
MKQGYIHSINSAAEFLKIVEAMNKVGVDSDNIIVNQSFGDFIETTTSGDCVVVYNLDFFQSLSEFMEVTIKLAQRGIHIRSLADTWYNVSPEMATLLMGITTFGKRIRARHTLAGLSRAKAEGKTLGRPVGTTKVAGKIEAIAKLRNESHMSISKACEVVKCNPRTYYRHVTKEEI